MKKRTLVSAFAALGLLALAVAGVGALTSNAVGAGGDPPSGVTVFALEVNGNTLGFFSDLDLTSEVKPTSVGAGTKTSFVPSKTSNPPPTVTLVRGLSSDLELSAWHELAVAGDPSARRNAAIVLFDATLTPVARYNLENAWPAKLELNRGPSDVMMESVTLVADRIHRVAP